jgi:hypothetical protein
MLVFCGRKPGGGRSTQHINNRDLKHSTVSEERRRMRGQWSGRCGTGSIPPAAAAAAQVMQVS